MVVHRYVVTDLVTDQTLGEVPCGGVSYTRRVGTPGEFTGGFPIGTPRLGDLARTLADRPCGLYAYRDDEIWWGGIVWQAPIRLPKRGEAARCDLVGATFDDLPNRRHIFTDLDIPANIGVLGVDRGEALAQLWDRMQADGPTAGAQVDPGHPVVGGEVWSGSWLGSAATTWGEAMKQVADTDPAVEWTIDVWADPDGRRRRALRVGAPLLGQTVVTGSWRPQLLVTPERVTSFDNIADHTSRPTHVLPRGTAVPTGFGAETEPLVGPVLIDADAVKAGAPRVDAVVDLETDDEKRLIAAGAAVLGGPNRVPQVTVTLPDGSGFNPGQVGNLGRLRLDGFAFTGGHLDDVRRLIGVTVQPAERGRPETVTFTFHDPAGSTL